MPESLVSWGLFLLGFVMHFFVAGEGQREFAIEWIEVGAGVAGADLADIRRALVFVRRGVWVVAEHSGDVQQAPGCLDGGAVTHPVPLNRETIALFGYETDSLLDKAVSICGFGIEVPKVAPPG